LITIHLEKARLNLHKPLRFKTKDADWENWSQICNEKGKDFTPIPSNASEEQIDYHINNLTSTIIELAKEHLGCQQICQKSKQWYNSNVRSAMDLHRSARRRYQKRQTPHNKCIYVESKNGLKKTIAQAK
jgi:hypothetical protein